MMTFIYFLITLGVLIFVHELGHFIMAKRAGIRVDVFSLGFGPRLFGVKFGGTDYRISLLPFGGYVKQLGEDPNDEGANAPDSFLAKSPWVRTKVIAAGPIMNALLAIALMPIVFMIGRVEPTYLHEAPVVLGIKPDTPAATAGIEKGDRILEIDGKKVLTWDQVMNEVLISANQDVAIVLGRGGAEIERTVKVGELPEIKGGYLGVEPIFFLGAESKIDSVKPGSPAEVAGIMVGDFVKSFAGRTVADFYDLSASINENGDREAAIGVLRDEKPISLKVKPMYSAEAGRFVIGITTNRRSQGPTALYRYGFIDSIAMGFRENVKLAKLTLDVLYRLVTLKLSYQIIGGPIIIAKVSAAAAASGIANFFYFMAFLSLQLAIFNVLPIPVLDGGQLFFVGIEAIRRRPLSIRITSIASQVGFVVLVSVMALVTLKDIENVWGITIWIKKIFNWS